MTENLSRSVEENAIFLLIGDLLAEGRYIDVAETVSDMNSADLAMLLQLLDDEEFVKVMKHLSVEQQAEVIPELSDSRQQLLGDELQNNQLSPIVDEMDSDDAADFVGLLDKDQQNAVLKQVEAQSAHELKELLLHEEDTAGGLMSKEFVAIADTASVEEAIGAIRKAVAETEQIYTVFVIEKESGILRGSLPLGTLILAKPQTIVSQIMVDTPSVPVHMDQEQVAQLAQKYDLPEIPVVDHENRLVGRITHDDILDVVEEEAVEDIAKMSGIGNEEASTPSAWQASRHRIPWQVIGLLGGVFSAFIMSRFESTIGKLLAIAFFTPVIAAMGGITGIQASSVTIRGLALGNVQTDQIWKRLSREISVTFINGAICSVLLGTIVTIWKGHVMIGMVVGFSLYTVMLASTFSGTIIPLLLSRVKADPAIASGPFVSTLNDLIGLTVYFTLATFAMNHFQHSFLIN